MGVKCYCMYVHAHVLRSAFAEFADCKARTAVSLGPSCFCREKYKIIHTRHFNAGKVA